MSNTIEQVAAGVLIFGFIGACIAAIIGFVVLCDRIKDMALAAFLVFQRSSCERHGNVALKTNR